MGSMSPYDCQRVDPLQAPKLEGPPCEVAPRLGTLGDHGAQVRSALMARRKTIRRRAPTSAGVRQSEIGLDHPVVNDLQVQLLRLRPGEQLKLPHSHFAGLSKEPLELTIVEIAVASGCDVKYSTLISEEPPVLGYIFTRRADVPILNWAEPEGKDQ
jgi:hypothetical protein